MSKSEFSAYGYHRNGGQETHLGSAECLKMQCAIDIMKLWHTYAVCWRTEDHMGRNPRIIAEEDRLPARLAGDGDV